MSRSSASTSNRIRPGSRAFLPSSSRRTVRNDDSGMWDKLDRAQVLGGPREGHRGCVNALSWSDDGSTLLSGSDDKRLCIWSPDPEPSMTNPSPHPMHLSQTIITGHKANIFSAKYLPNANTPTIVSCAGDMEIRVVEVERLGKAEMSLGGAGGGSRGRYGRGDWGSDELWGVDGPGVRVLKCHTDRTKKIATENSPSLFLSVSEDGTVRQHDLRRPHQCRDECPEPLFLAPRNVDLFSLSVSPVTPHIFAVAGRTDCAFICDRRMPERQTPSWGNRIKSSGQVHCVRRLGLPEEEWDEDGSSGGMFRSERHISCVKMSSHKADEVICSFMEHSTSLFSLYDSPTSPSMKHGTASPNSSSGRKTVERVPLDSPPRGTRYKSSEFERDSSVKAESSNLGKRRQSDLDSVVTQGERARPRVGTGVVGDLDEDDDAGDVVGLEFGVQDGLGDLDLDLELRYCEGGSESEKSGRRSRSLSGTLTRLIYDRNDNTIELDTDPNADEDDDDDGDEDDDESDDMDEEEDMMDLEDYAEHAEDMYDDDDDDYDEEDGMGGDAYGERRVEETEFAGVEMILPRRCFRGAKNVQTVKDCNFLGARSDKVCSGSDDGNFFVWDKESGKLDGIWEGDGHVVNVIEQHPTLPIVATSGIDSTVKLFTPLPHPPDPSFYRLHLQESIVKANTRRAQFTSGSNMATMDIMEYLNAMGISAQTLDTGADGAGGVGRGVRDAEDLRNCTTQ